MLPLSSIHAVMPQPAAASPETMPLRTPAMDLPQPLSRPSEIVPGRPSESFGNLLGRLVEEVNARQNVSAAAVHELQTGGNVSLHQAVIAMEEASISFQLMVEVRNKLLESYQELMRMQV